MSHWHLHCAPWTNRKTVRVNLFDSNAICIERIRQQGECKMNVYSSSRLFLNDKNTTLTVSKKQSPAEKSLYLNCLKHASQFETSMSPRLLTSRICSDLTKGWIISQFIDYRTFISGETFAEPPNLCIYIPAERLLKMCQYSVSCIFMRRNWLRGCNECISFKLAFTSNLGLLRNDAVMVILNKRR